jgi:hypothetical protein
MASPNDNVIKGREEAADRGVSLLLFFWEILR